MADPVKMVGPIQAAVRRVVKENILLSARGNPGESTRGLPQQRRFQTSLLIGFSVVAIMMAVSEFMG
jgi:hypothetical protein